MAKRFTETEKWSDKWFRRLPSDQKLAYLYILDRCDMAGTVDIDEDLAEFQMGCPTDWEGLVKGSEGRLVLLPNGRIWVVKFIAFQHGTLSAACNAHKSALQIVEKYSLPISNENKDKSLKGSSRVQEPLGKGPGNSNGNSNGNSKEEEGVGEETPKRFTPPTVEQVRAYCTERKNQVDAEHFVDHYTANGWKVGKNSMKCWKASVRTWEKNNISGTQPKPQQEHWDQL